MTKRGTEELNGAEVINGSAMSQQPEVVNGSLTNGSHSNNNDAKKLKLEKMQNGTPSKVVHIRSTPADVTEAEIINMGLPFGRVTNYLVLKGKNQAFLEMADELSASTMVNYYSNCSAQLRGRPVYVQYSNYKELKTDPLHSNNNGNGQAAQRSANSFQGGSSDASGGPTPVLRTVIENMVYPINLDVLHQIFSRHGRVLKIVTFTKDNTFQALIQYPDSSVALAAKTALNGQNIYNACCTLRIDFSKLTNLVVKFNNEKGRDYTSPNLPAGMREMDALMGLTGHGVLPSPFAAALQLTNPLAAAFGSSMGVPMGGFALPTAGHHSLSAAGLQMAYPGNVLLVSNLNEEMITPDALFTLFGVFGDVQRVKILFNKKDNALIQMVEPMQAQIALTHLDKLKLFGKPIRVMISKHQQVQLPRDGQPDAGLTKDYTSSPLHRFKKPGSKNYQNIYPPSSTLHLSNIPESVSEEDLKEAFTGTGSVVKNFKFFPKDRKMALIELGSVEEAVTSLIKMHNYQLADSSHLRVSFSKSKIS